MNETWDVAVVGAGPVGLLAAIELALGGVRVVVLERLAEPSGATKAMSIGPLGTEALQRRGMAAAIVAAEQRTVATMQRFAARNGPDVRAGGTRFSGHFAGLPLIRKDAQKEPARHAHPADQPAVEAMLGERARALGVEVRRGCDITRIAAQDGRRRRRVEVARRRAAPALRVAGRLRRRPQPGAQVGRLRIPRHAADADDAAGRRRGRPPRAPAAARLAPHAGRRVLVRPVPRPPVHAGLQPARRRIARRRSRAWKSSPCCDASAAPTCA